MANLYKALKLFIYIQGGKNVANIFSESLQNRSDF